MIRVDSLQKKIGYLLLGIGLYSILVNTVLKLQGNPDFYSIISKESLATDFILVITGLLSIFLENRYIKALQVIFILLAATAHIFLSYNEFYGPSLFFMNWLLLRQYGYFKRHKKPKYFFLAGYFIFIIQLSAYIHEKTVFLLGNEVFQFSIFIIVFILIVWEDIFTRDKELLTENEHLKKDYYRIADRLEAIEKSKQRVDLEKAGITPAEKRVLRELVLGKSSNRGIAQNLHISEATVKLHLYNIFNKLGVDTRMAAIDMCKNNFTENK